MADTVFITKERIEELQQERKEIVEVTIPEVADRINRAKELGDLSENFEYHEARDRMGFVHARLQEIDHIINNAVIYTAPKTTGSVTLGSAVTVTKGGEEKILYVVGAQEADPLAGKISNESPLGSALMGRKVGEHAVVTTPKGDATYTIVHIG